MKIIKLLLIVLVTILLILAIRWATNRLPISDGVAPKQPVWVFKAPTRVDCSPSAEDSLVVFQTAKSTYVLESSTGAIRWEVDIPQNETSCYSPLIIDKYVIVETRKGDIAVLVRDTGEMVWKTSQGIAGNPVEDIKVSNGIVYVARYNSYLTAYALDSGEILWDKSVPDRSSLFLVPHNDKIILAAGELIRVYDAVSGKLVLEKHLETGIIKVVSDEKTLYLAVTQGDFVNLLAVDINSFESLWDISFRTYTNPAGAKLNLVNHVLYLSGDHISSISCSNGKLLWINKSLSDLGMSTVLDDKIFVPEWDSRLHILDASTGTEIGKISVSNFQFWTVGDSISPIKSGDLLIWNYSNRVFAYRP
jgi:outer membrane protein assembly factor BamB